MLRCSLEIWREVECVINIYLKFELESEHIFSYNSNFTKLKFEFELKMKLKRVIKFNLQIDLNPQSSARNQARTLYRDQT